MSKKMIEMDERIEIARNEGARLTLNIVQYILSADVILRLLITKSVPIEIILILPFIAIMNYVNRYTKEMTLTKKDIIKWIISSLLVFLIILGLIAWWRMSHGLSFWK
jgi:hypothetical protein